MKKSIAILGSTGSVGTQVIDVADKEGLKINILSADRDVLSIEKQARKFSPAYCVMNNEKAAKDLKIALSDTNIKVLCGLDGIIEAINSIHSDVTVNSISGAAGLLPTMSILDTDTRLALANKESLVIAGKYVIEKAKNNGREILPVDSEHCAIFQCLNGSGNNIIKKILLTASGGPFFGRSRVELADITVDDALAHPTWKMGKQITIDSATLMNKGFEVIEASYLFGVEAKNIEVVVQRESIIHSMIEYYDNSVIAQMSVPDMRLCVQYAVNYPERKGSVIDELDFSKLSVLKFGKPDLYAFPLLKAAYDVMEAGGALPAILNASNEIAVDAFINKKIGFNEISDIVLQVIEKMSKFSDIGKFDEILNCDLLARKYTNEAIMTRG